MRALTRLFAQLSCLLLPASVLAVSLGDEVILSRLGDPVEIEIEVLQWEDMDLDRVEISAATQEEYDVFKLTWLPVLDELSFNLVGPDLDGDVRVLISSREPLNEPFLELLLVLRWPGGSLRREYVLLFDPPGGPEPVASPVVETTPTVVRTVPQLPPAEESAPPVAIAPVPVVVTPEPEPQVVPEPEESAVPDARTQIAIEVDTLNPQTQPVVLDTTRRTYQIRPGDSLWNIARQFRPAGAGENLYQMLLSIHDLNRNAFINGNISLMKANAVLQIPTVDDINRIDPLAAEAEFDRRWNEGTQRFDAVQRGEAIPLFANDPPPEEVVVEEELPLGEEAPLNSNDDENALIMVSQTNVPQPLQIADDTETTDASVADTTAAEPPIQRVTIQTQTVTTVPEPPDAGDATPVTGLVQRTVTRAVLTAELETELAAMQARRQSAEEIAAQLNASLQRARDARAAQASLFGMENLLLAGSALGLFAALLVAIVFSLRIAGDLRMRRELAADTALDSAAEPAWLAGSAKTRDAAQRKEPHMPEMDVVELQLPGTSGSDKRPVRDDLFARMDDLLGPGDKNSGKNS